MSCSRKTKDSTAKEFYFPYRTFFHSPVVYRYVNENDSTDFSNWVMESSIIGKDTILRTEIHHPGQGSITESFSEKITGSGTLVQNYILFSQDSTGKSESETCKIIQDSVFKWNYLEGDSSVWKVSYAEQGRKMEMLKARLFTGDSVVFTILGKDHTCMEFYDRYVINVLPLTEKKEEHYSYFVQSYYAKGIGLVGYKLSLPGAKRKDFILKKVIRPDMDPPPAQGQMTL